MASVRLCLIISFCPYVKPLSTTIYLTQVASLTFWVMGATRSVWSVIRKLFLVESCLNIISILECCFVEDFQFNHYFLQEELFLSIFTKGSIIIPKNLQHTKTDEGKYFKKEHHIFSPQSASLFHSLTAYSSDPQYVHAWTQYLILSSQLLPIPNSSSSTQQL